MVISYISVPRIILVAVLMVRVASGQTFTNGSFETDAFNDGMGNGWQVAGVPMVVGGPPTPEDGSWQALINSTGTTAPGIYANSNSVTAAQLKHVPEYDAAVERPRGAPRERGGDPADFQHDVGGRPLLFRTRMNRGKRRQTGSTKRATF